MRKRWGLDPAATELHVLRILELEPDLTQRQLAVHVGISLGALNHCINALAEKGMVKVKNFANSRNKLGYAYVLTPHGVAEKAALTRRFLKRKLAEYEELRMEVDALRKEVGP